MVNAKTKSVKPGWPCNTVNLWKFGSQHQTNYQKKRFQL